MVSGLARTCVSGPPWELKAKLSRSRNLGIRLWRLRRPVAHEAPSHKPQVVDSMPYLRLLDLDGLASGFSAEYILHVGAFPSGPHNAVIAISSRERFRMSFSREELTMHLEYAGAPRD